MADWPPLKNAAFTVTFPIYDNDGDPVSAAAGLDSEVSIDGGAFADCTNEATEISGGRGVYTLALTAAEMNGDIIATITISTTTDSKDAVNVMYTVVRQLQDLAFPTTSGRSIDVETTGEVGINLDNVVGTLDAAEIGADAITAAKIANGAIDAATFAAGAIDAAAVANGAIDAATFAAGAIDAAAIATDAVDADALAADAVDEIWDEALSGHTTLGTFGQAINAVAARTGEVNDVGPAAGDFDVDGFTEATDDHFNGMTLMFTSGALTGQARTITDYTGTGQNMVFAEPFTEAPADNDDFVILPPATLAGASLATVLRLFITILDQSTGQIDAGSFAAGAIDAAAIATAAIDADSIATDAITAAKIAASAITSSEAPNLDAAVSTRATPAQVNTEVSDVLKVDTISELAQGIPSATPTFENALMLLYMALRNRLDIDTGGASDFKEIYNDAGTVITKKTLTDDGTVYSEAKMASGP